MRVVAPGDFGEAAAAAVVEMVAGLDAPVVGLPTGNTPGVLYAALRRLAELGAFDAGLWRPVAIDEYGGPRHHPCSNRAYFEQHWDAIPGARPVLQFDPEADDPDGDCLRMAEAVEAMGGLDVAVLGIGMNGHLAFNEPGSSLDSKARRVLLHGPSMTSARACWGEETPSRGLTLGLRELTGARAVLLLASGGSKAAIVQAAIEGPVSSAVPASFVRTAPNHLYLLDSAAGANLTLG